MDKYRITPEQLERTHAALDNLDKGHRIELIPLKDNIKNYGYKSAEYKYRTARNSRQSNGGIRLWHSQKKH
jgi:hypothetical protein